MDLGVAIFLTDVSIRPDTVARAAEKAGFGSLWVCEHTHLPVDHAVSPGGRELPEHYRRTLDPFVSLATAAQATRSIRLGTAICLVPQRDPFTTAKEVATLDHLSGGRFEFGIGYGWVRQEIENHGVAFSERRSVTRDRILAMKSLWTEDVASFASESVSFGPSWAWPKPIQAPHPPIFLGAGLGPTSLAHLVEFCDGWLPIGRTATRQGIETVRTALRDAGRDPEAFSVTVLGARPEPGAIEDLAAIGADRVVLWLPPADEATVLEELDRLTGLVEVS